MRLSPTLLSSLDISKVGVVKFDRSKLKAGILHLGVGNFHRAHMATYMNDLFERDFENSKQWGIIGAGTRQFDAERRDKCLKPQEWLQTVIERDADSVKAKVVGSMIDFLPVDYKDQKHVELRKAMTDPNIKIVSMTITEGGYYISDGKFDPENAEIQLDIQNPEEPKTIFGMIIEALKKRKEAGVMPFTVLSCDNIPHNGKLAKSVVVGLAKYTDPVFSQWIEDNVAFPSSMVDRITPATTDSLKVYVRETLGYDDEVPIMCEPFRQWVLEDNFPAGRPALEQLDGVTFVDDVAPYENMKIRILNGGHAALCYPSALVGVTYVHEAMQHETIAAFLDALQIREIIPTVKPVPDMSEHEYWKIIAKRFANPTIADTVTRVCFDGGSRQCKFIIPTAADRLKDGKSVDGLALVSAMWCRYCQETTESGEIIASNDPQWDRLQGLAKKSYKDPTVWLGMNDIYGTVGRHPAFVEAFTNALKLIETSGVVTAMKKYIECVKEQKDFQEVIQETIS